MLIKCPECNRDISDKAHNCPSCGYPVQTPIRKQTTKYRQKKRPNRQGSIKKLSGNRSKPFAVYPPNTGFKENGSPNQTKSLGLFATYNEALTCLTEYLVNPYNIDKRNMTFKEACELFLSRKFNVESISKLDTANSSQRAYKTAYGHCSSVHSVKLKDLRTDDLQALIDGCNKSYSTKKSIFVLIRGVFRMAMKNDYIAKNYARYIELKQDDCEETESGVPFYEDEIKTLWKYADSDDEKIRYTCRFALIMIYSGFRISAFEPKNEMIIDLDKKTFQGGVKTKRGKNRLVPIHPAICNFVAEMDFSNFVSKTYRDKRFAPVMKEIGLDIDVEGGKHTPHDCRHTFSWLCDKYKVDEISKHLLMGHSMGSDIEKSVYGHRTPEELRTEIEKIKVDNNTNQKEDSTG